MKIHPKIINKFMIIMTNKIKKRRKNSIKLLTKQINKVN